MIGQSIYNAIHLSALTFANMPTLRGANIELSDASTSGGTVLMNSQAQPSEWLFNDTDGINITNNLLIYNNT